MDAVESLARLGHFSRAMPTRAASLGEWELADCHCDHRSGFCRMAFDAECDEPTDETPTSVHAELAKAARGCS